MEIQVQTSSRGYNKDSQTAVQCHMSTNREKNEAELKFTNSIAHVQAVQSCTVIENLIGALVLGGISSVLGAAFITALTQPHR